MSLKLNIDTNPPVHTHTHDFCGKPVIGIDNSDIGLEDFCELVKYVLTNTDLIPNDPRLDLIEKIKEIKLVEGYMGGKKHLSF